jgi:hypothetical protein
MTITEQELRGILESLTGHNDFELVFKKEYNEKDYGYYFYNLKKIELYVLDENLLCMDRDTLIKAGIHEITHHVLINHSENSDEDFHGDEFKTQFAKYLKVYYNNRVPRAVIEELKKEGLYIGIKKGKPIRSNK